MPNNPFRSKKGYVAVSGALRKMTRQDAATDQRAVSKSLSNSELAAGNGSPTPVSTGAAYINPDRYDAFDRDRAI